MANELVELTLRFAPTPGIHDTAVPALQIVRADGVQPGIKTLHKPSACFVVQGAKEVTIGGEVLRYAANEVAVSTVELPITGGIVAASRKQPYLCLALELEPSLVVELASAVEDAERAAHVRSERVLGRAMTVGEADPGMITAFHRLVHCLAHPLDAQVLAPTLIREITYRLLRGPYGPIVRELGIVDSQTHRIAKVIQRLKVDFAKPLRTATLAKLAGMSVSSFHDHFRKVTTLSPLQYQKQLRLYEARRLLLHHTAAADVAFQVGYESPSQFSREYARFFGLPPLSDARRLLAAQGSSRNAVIDPARSELR
jgi:AraC-like DNA-binding protein